jgi:hypothetical protein
MSPNSGEEETSPGGGGGADASAAGGSRAQEDDTRRRPSRGGVDDLTVGGGVAGGVDDLSASNSSSGHPPGNGEGARTAVVDDEEEEEEEVDDEIARATSELAELATGDDGGGSSVDDEIARATSELAELATGDDGGGGGGAATAATAAKKVQDVFDRMGYGSSSDDDDNDGRVEESGTDEDDEDRDHVTPLLDAIRAVASGAEPLHAPSIGALGWSLSYELSSHLSQRDDLPGAPLADMPPLVTETVESLGVLASALTMAPAAAVTQRSGATTPASGSHRVAVIEIVATLLEMGTPEVTRAVARCRVDGTGGGAGVAGGGEGENGGGEGEGGSGGGGGGDGGGGRGEGGLGFVSAAAAMLLTHTQGSPLHCAVTRLLCAALLSAEESLWAPLLEGGWGAAAAAAGVTPPPADASGASGSLQARLAEAATAAAELSPGMRPCNVGSIVFLADTLRELEGDEDPPHLLLREKLEADAAWQKFAGEEGALEALKLEQQGGLCG